MTTPSKPTIAITGASGFLGSELVRHFVAKDWNVIGLVRNAAERRGQNITYREYDISSPPETSLLAGVDYLVHAAYVKFDRQHPDAMEINIAGAQRLHELASQHKLQKTVFISSMSAHDEAISEYGKQKLAIEAIFRDPSDVILRCGLMIGNGGLVKKMTDFMKSTHLVPIIGGGKQPLQIVGIHDLVKVIDTALIGPFSGIYTIATPEIYTYKQFYQALARALRIKVVFVPLPYSALSGIFKTAGLLHLPLSMGEENLKGLRKLRSMETAQDLEKLGVTLEPLDRALKQTAKS